VKHSGGGFGGPGAGGELRRGRERRSDGDGERERNGLRRRIPVRAGCLPRRSRMDRGAEEAWGSGGTDALATMWRLLGSGRIGGSGRSGTMKA